MDADLIDFTEARARDHRVRYNRYLAPRRLLARVLKIEHRGLDGLEDGRKPVSCFGSSFAGYQDSACAVCQLQAACLVRTTAKTLPDIEAEVGADPRAIAQAMDVPMLAVGLMYAMREAIADPDELEHVPVAQLKHGVGRHPVPDLSAHRNPPKRAPVATLAACLFGAQAAETAWPPPVRMTTHRLGNGLRDTFTIQAFAHVPARLKYGSPVWIKRVAKDRFRLPELDWLPDGTVLRRIKKGERIEVKVYRDRLEWRGQVFATLYEVTAAVCGRIEYKMPPSRPNKNNKGTRLYPRVSAKRFFDVCFMQIYQRAAALQHMRAEHPDLPMVLPQPAFTACPACQAELATVRGKDI